ncbi:DUF192 domain-containing protein [Dyadobacter fermentans]|uniref:DUF192 domain-containing protein n=1 Tax=Dyadobacter fermentans (strain ATCC 700827 / DSM 18053 / CIP 107007 / KCTC 52180 / NS114) TaxID=471854 RepID=C6VXS6_DYAFD|nr:DUF192 domain-containing protein [Dyadobacter fermentans]ACT95109.1 protein of unknown function DUF192 [Dyadobacter fermentans DSM 18053]
MKKRQSVFAFILLAAFVLGGVAYLAGSFSGGDKTAETPAAGPAPVFVKEGEVSFLRKGETYKKIDVEIAENEAERNKGLMFRPYLPDSVGMLFIFEQPDTHSFWMKNTSIPLDIIYVGPDKTIVSIAENTRPYSEASIPPNGIVQYVVEVNAGFTKNNNIQSGDAISF